MEKLQRNQLMDYQTWTDRRDEELQRILAVKAPRRLHLGPHLTFLFENRDTVRWQVQEMMRVEQIVREKDIQHELDTYNDLLGRQGELGATLLVEIDNPEERAVKLSAWLALPQHLYAELPDGTRVRPRVDERQIGEGRLSSVQYLKFDVGGQVPAALGCDLPAYTHREVLGPAQRQALESDLAG